MLSLKRSVLLSAGAHVGIFLALVLSSQTSRAKVVYKPQYQVRLVAPAEVPALNKGQKKSAPKPKAVVKKKPAKNKVVIPDKKAKKKKEVKKTKTPKKQISQEKKKSPPKKAPQKKTAPQEPAHEKALEDVLARIKKRASSRDRLAANGPTGTLRGLKERQQEIQYRQYYDEVERQVRQNWIPPKNLDLSQQDVMTVVALVLLPDGRVLRSAIEESSGNSLFDQSVVRAVLKSTPLPPPPIGLNQQSFELGLRFHSQPH